MIEFPKDFFWGAATSSYQVEGNNINSDWWEWEKRVGTKDVSGEACRHYELYKEDFDLARLLNHNAHRLSIEWSRIEPEEGRFSKKEIDHYKDVILSLRQRNIEPVVTLHHFTNPLWFTGIGGWQNKNAASYFSRYVEYVVEALCGSVCYWVTINEPMVYVYLSYILGTWPPQEKSLLKAKITVDNFILAHVKAYRLIHGIYKKLETTLSFIKRNDDPSVFVSVAHHIQAFLPCTLNLRDRFASYLRDRLFNFGFINRLIRKRSLDFIGVNYYSRSLVEVQGWSPKNLFLDVCKKNHHPLKRNSMGWDIYPQGLHSLLLRLRVYNLPIFILENGICTEDDTARWEFIYEHLKSIHMAMGQGVRVLGYIYWSLIDNFEWDKGFGPRFGLIEVDYRTYKRTIRESAKKLSLICKTGRLD